MTHIAKHLLTRKQLCLNSIIRHCQKHILRSFSQSRAVHGVFEPDDLKLEPDIPEYATLNLRMRGYDFTTLEAYSKYVRRLTVRLGFETDDWPVPARSFDIKTFKPNSTIEDKKYQLKMFERTVQIENVPSPRLQILLEMMRMNAPEGVFITVKEPDPEEEEFRYIPDKEMQDLQAQIKAIDDAREEKKKK
ncbi:39S ribosomal protein L48, mitochondrial-like isoform X2 [Pomacea canaliculata]|uniref:39S ribosomal protein L48, mitochondrial-like isoform X2 n=1 Tax=Pomacea canaliculata TaxID=400727 RepID=UPI000D73B8AD|nr:39S ribosomal protein L48, mitochondrial-like isoform X2 [Pomacea canaliculata]XP_025104773.1 39S ribosomal protein L48, mitochondrial-like isoform X2 [Pomacea canaliculata]XP_025104774.1 39S ribosomal protein L48, mitochondrial-like isoform X2 [Pomacea canaliculata]